MRNIGNAAFESDRPKGKSEITSSQYLAQFEQTLHRE